MPVAYSFHFSESAANHMKESGGRRDSGSVSVYLKDKTKACPIR